MRSLLRFILKIILINSLAGCATPQILHNLESTPQNISAFITPKQKARPLISRQQQQQLSKEYLKHYFSPWSGQAQILTLAEIRQAEEKVIEQFLKAPGWAINQNPYPHAWIEEIVANIQLKDFPNSYHKAISVNATDIRVLPTNKPSFTDFTSAGEGCPFDNLQTSWLPAGLPVLILHTTRDGAWKLIMTHNVIGWVSTINVALVDEKFIRQWRTGKYVVAKQDDAPLQDSKRYFYMTHLGTLYPFSKTLKDGFQIPTAVANTKQQAVIKTARLTVAQAVPFPLPMTVTNMANIAGLMIDEPYGWGGLYGYRDCSATLQDLFAFFGVWLPRNSSDQKQIGQVISLVGLSNREKEQRIRQYGKPFLTIIGLPGHVMWYLGEQDKQVYAYQTVWGVHTNFFGKKGRIVIGKTVITPLAFDEAYLNTESFLTRTRSMNILL